jgi:hypothetical protein
MARKLPFRAASSTICKTVCLDFMPPLNLGTAQNLQSKTQRSETVM